MPRILLVEDDVDIQGYAKTVLESEGMSVTACLSVAEAKALFEQGAPDLVVLDIGLPDGSGMDLCRTMVQRTGGRVPIIVLTGRRDMNTRLEAFKAGAQDYIEKPFAVPELVARVHVHLKIKKSQDEMARRNYDLQLMNRARQDMTDMILHDLKTPLASIKGTLELVKMRGIISDKAYGGLVDHAGAAADFMLLMLNDLLDLAQSEQMSLRVTKTQFEVRSMMERLRTLFAPRLNSMKIEMIVNLADDAYLVESDQNLIFRVLVNLISNALRHSPRGGAVEVAITAKSGTLRLAVADRGPGVAPKLKAAIFEKGVTTHALSKDAGHGIGLAFCRLAVETLDGKIRVEDREGGGSVFVVEIPKVARGRSAR